MLPRSGSLRSRPRWRKAPPRTPRRRRAETLYLVFDLDGTLVDSDEALIAPFVALGIDREAITFGHVLAHECERLGISVDDYLDHYDEDAARPFPGVAELLARVGPWAVCSNKHPRYGRAELARLGWEPEVAWFSDAFGGGPKTVAPLLDHLGVAPAEAVFVGDTAHDRQTAADAGVAFILAGWNPRAEAVDGDLVACDPLDVLHLAEAAVAGRS